MMRIMALAAMAALAGQQAADVPMQPSGPWGVDYGENACTLSRSFGTGDDAVSLGFIPVTGGGAVKIVMIGGRGDRLGGNGTAVLTMSGHAPETLPFFSTTDRTSFKPVALVKGSRETLAAIADAKQLTLAAGRGHQRTLSFALPGMAAAMRALDDCESVLMNAWGFDAAKAVHPARPIGPEKWASSVDYPHMAMEQRQAGETDFRLMVSPEGKPTDCQVTLHSGSSALDERTCEVLMRHASFAPATDAEGKPVAGIYANAILWMLEARY